jgi:hypothetical protein
MHRQELVQKKTHTQRLILSVKISGNRVKDFTLRKLTYKILYLILRGLDDSLVSRQKHCRNKWYFLHFKSN